MIKPEREAWVSQNRRFLLLMVIVEIEQTTRQNLPKKIVKNSRDMLTCRSFKQSLQPLIVVTCFLQTCVFFIF